MKTAPMTQVAQNLFNKPTNEDNIEGKNFEVVTKSLEKILLCKICLRSTNDKIKKFVVASPTRRVQANRKNMKTVTMTPVAQNKTVLVLNSDMDGDWQPALLIDSNGRQEELNCFAHDDRTIVSQSCSLVWNNQFYFYGGYHLKRQISKLRVWSTKFMTPQRLLMLILGLRRVDYLGKYFSSALFLIFAKMKKYYICVLFFSQNQIQENP